MTTTVTTQAELDTALANDTTDRILIDTPSGIWLTISSNNRHPVEAGGSATVEAWDSATVEAWGSATVRAWDSATVRAWHSATVEAGDSATVEAGDSATVRAGGSATVRAGGSATVRAWGSATVEAWGSATVRAGGSATVRAWGSATVEAWDSATVRAWGSATVKATPYVAVHLHSAAATVTGGHIIDTTGLDLTDPATWCAYHGVTVDTEGLAHLYKAVDADLAAGHRWTLTVYTIGATIRPDEWRDNHQCGYGLHACPRPSQALDHYPQATRFLEVACPVTDLRPIDDTKAKAPALTVLREVDIAGVCGALDRSHL